MPKKSFFVIVVVGNIIFLIAMYSRTLGICNESNYQCIKNWDAIQHALGIFPLLFLFSLIIANMKPEVFQSWWRVARWFVLGIIIVTFLFNMPQTGGLGGVSGAYADTFTILILGLLYALFIVISLVRIFFAYRKSR